MLGPEVDWRTVEAPLPGELRGRHVTLRPVTPDDAEALFAVSQDPGIWTYLPYGPYESVEAMRSRLAEIEGSADPLFYAVVRDGKPQGIVSYLRIDPENGSVEIGHIWFGTPLQRTTAATEAIYLLAKHAIDDLGYRRFEWKCNDLNAPSKAAARRFGFTFEGVFRQHMIIKGANRDTAWFSMLDREWPERRARFERWLDASNFDEAGRQKRALGAV